MKVLTKVQRPFLCAALGTSLVLGLSGMSANTAQAGSKPDVITGHKVTLSYDGSCYTKNGRLYVQVSKKAKPDAMLCAGKVATNKYALPMYMRFIVVKASKAGSTARVNVLLQLSPPAKKKHKHTTISVKPYAVGRQYSGGQPWYAFKTTYRWLNNLATQNTSLLGMFETRSKDNDSNNPTTVFTEELRLKVYYKPKA